MTRDEIAEELHKVYIACAKSRGWRVRTECDVTYAELSDDAKALDLAFADWHLKQTEKLTEQVHVQMERAEKAEAECATLRHTLASDEIQFKQWENRNREMRETLIHTAVERDAAREQCTRITAKYENVLRDPEQKRLRLALEIADAELAAALEQVRVLREDVDEANAWGEEATRCQVAAYNRADELAEHVRVIEIERDRIYSMALRENQKRLNQIDALDEQVRVLRKQAVECQRIPPQIMWRRGIDKPPVTVNFTATAPKEKP